MAARVSLREITRENLRAVCDLDVLPEQREFVARNTFSLAEAYAEPRAWPRAIYADETPVGFLMLHEDREACRYFLWRMMIDARYQGNGYGKAALDLLRDHVQSLPGATELLSSYGAGDAGPGTFYRSYGFIETGERTHGEIVIRLAL